MGTENPAGSPAPANGKPRPGTVHWLVWPVAIAVLLGLGVLGFVVGRASVGVPSRMRALPQGGYQPAVSAGATETAPASPEPLSANAGQIAASPEAEGAVGVEEGAIQGSPPPPSSSQGVGGPAYPSLNPRNVPAQVASEVALRVDAAYEPRLDDSGSVAGLTVRGTVSNLTENRVNSVVFTFAATGAIVVSQANYEALIHAAGSALPPPAVQPYWNREVILAYQANVVPNLGPGEQRRFEFVAPMNVGTPPGLRTGEVVQSWQPEEVSLLVRTEGVAPLGAPITPQQR